MPDKTMAERVKECVSIIKKLTDSLMLPEDSAPVIELRSRMNDYIRTGEPWAGTVDFSSFGRIANCVFPREAGRTIEVTLKVKNKNNIY
jgi:methionyl-tRNA synthetase